MNIWQHWPMKGKRWCQKCKKITFHINQTCSCGYSFQGTPHKTRTCFVPGCNKTAMVFVGRSFFCFEHKHYTRNQRAWAARLGERKAAAIAEQKKQIDASLIAKTNLHNVKKKGKP